jgi:hypothetical protein
MSGITHRGRRNPIRAESAAIEVRGLLSLDLEHNHAHRDCDGDRLGPRLESIDERIPVAVEGVGAHHDQIEHFVSRELVRLTHRGGVDMMSASHALRRLGRLARWNPEQTQGFDQLVVMIRLGNHDDNASVASKNPIELFGAALPSTRSKDAKGDVDARIADRYSAPDVARNSRESRMCSSRTAKGGDRGVEHDAPKLRPRVEHPRGVPAGAASEVDEPACRLGHRVDDGSGDAVVHPTGLHSLARLDHRHRVTGRRRRAAAQARVALFRHIEVVTGFAPDSVGEACERLAADGAFENLESGVEGAYSVGNRARSHSRHCTPRDQLRRPPVGGLSSTAVGDIQPHLTSNVEQFSQRIKMRDDVDRSREVEHFANFGAIKEAHAAARELERRGYSASVTRRRLFGGTLRATRQSTVDVETADAMVEEVFGVVEANRGEYDGWAAPIIRN